MRIFVILSFALFAMGCTFERGHGFATVTGAHLDAKLEPGPARDLGSHTVLTDRSYEVRLDEASFTVDRIELQELSGGSTGQTFDPAKPPSGYTLCHNGHCHAIDGRLVDYADVEAELAGGTASFVPVLALPHGELSDLLNPSRTELRRFEPSRELPKATLKKITVNVSRLTLRGDVAGGPAVGGFSQPVPFSVALDLNESWDSGIELSIDREEPGDLDLTFEVAIGGTIFDGIDFAAEAMQGPLDVASSEQPIALALLASLSEIEVLLKVR